MKTRCDDCGSVRLAESDVAAYGPYGPDLLPGTGLFSHARFTVRVCQQCGRVYWWVRSQDLEKVKKSRKFKTGSS